MYAARWQEQDIMSGCPWPSLCHKSEVRNQVCPSAFCHALHWVQDKWRNLNMDASGSRGDKRGSRTKNRAKQRQRAVAAAAAAAPEPVSAATASVLAAGPPARVLCPPCLCLLTNAHAIQEVQGACQCPERIGTHGHVPCSARLTVCNQHARVCTTTAHKICDQLQQAPGC